MRITPFRVGVGAPALVLALVLAVVLFPGQSLATPPSGVTASPLIRGSFTDHVSVKFTVRSGHHKIVSSAKDASQVIQQTVTVAPGGNTGWHTHPGPVVVTIQSGTFTYYDGEGRCRGRAYPAGTSFLDPGNGHVHVARNEGTVPMVASIVFFGVPEGESPRIDIPTRPGNCPF